MTYIAAWRGSTDEMKRWKPDTNSFHISFGEMTITLHDIAYILQLNVGGWPVSTTSNLADTIALVVEIMSETPDRMTCYWRQGGTSLDKVVVTCGDDLPAPLISCVRGYLMHLVRTSLFLDKSGCRLKPFYCLLDNLDDVSQYPWGATMLAYLYRQLRHKANV